MLWEGGSMVFHKTNSVPSTPFLPSNRNKKSLLLVMWIQVVVIRLIRPLLSHGDDRFCQSLDCILIEFDQPDFSMGGGGGGALVNRACLQDVLDCLWFTTRAGVIVNSTDPMEEGACLSPACTESVQPHPWLTSKRMANEAWRRDVWWTEVALYWHSPTLYAIFHQPMKV